MNRVLLLVLSLLPVVSLRAATPEVVDSLINLNGVVVTANRIYVNRSNVPLSISVIDRKQIESSSESALLPVLSKRIPGLFVTEKGITGFGVSSGSAG
ncbi:MAG: TonB-dependent receptor, partial [Parabacteroides sp.]